MSLNLSKYLLGSLKTASIIKFDFFSIINSINVDSNSAVLYS